MKISKRKDRNLWYASVKKPDGGYKRVYGKTKREVREKYDKAIQEISSGEFIDDSKVTLSAWAKNWFKSYTLNLKGSTKKTYKSHLKNYIIPKFGDYRLSKISHNQVQSFITEIAGSGISAKSVHNIHLTLHRLLRDAKTAGLISKNPADRVVLPKIVRKQMDFFDEDGIVAMLKKAKELYPDYVDIFEFMLLTGMRVSEVLGLTVDRYDKKNKTVLIDRQLNSSNYYTLETPKHDSIRKIYISDKVVSIIENRIAKQKEDKHFLGKYYQNKEGFIFTRETGEHLTQSMLYKRFKRVVREVGLPFLRLHDLRHAYVTMCLKSGIDVKQIQESLGHSDATFTVNRYAHATEKMKRDGAEKMVSYYAKLFE